MKTKLLVHRTYPKKIAGTSLLDRTNDPEMRLGLPMTFGDCRPNVRTQAHVGDVFVFIAYVPDDPTNVQYYLDAYFKVAKILDQGEAMRRFGRRPNVLLEAMAGDNSAQEMVCLKGVWYQHAAWDDHVDWEHRVQSPYLVSDTIESRIIRPGIPWADLARECDDLRSLSDLKNKSNHHPPSLIKSEGVRFLEARMKA
jgi:hypothetical protein